MPLTLNERKTIGLEFADMAVIYGRRLEHRQIVMMIDDLDDLSAEAILGAMRAYRRSAQGRTFPLPAQIREIARPSHNPLAIGRDAAAKVAQAVVKFGYSNPEDAKEWLGQLGWVLVERSGGWSYLCQNLGVTINPTTFIAQSRDLGADYASDENEYDQMALEYKKPEQLTNSAGELIRSLSDRKKL